MPDLPTVSVTQDQHDLILNAFGNTAAYEAWLISNVNSYVLAVENNSLTAEKAAEISAALEAVKSELPEIPSTE